MRRVDIQARRMTFVHTRSVPKRWLWARHLGTFFTNGGRLGSGGGSDGFTFNWGERSVHFFHRKHPFDAPLGLSQAECNTNGTIMPGALKVAIGPEPTCAALNTSTRNPPSFRIGTTT